METIKLLLLLLLPITALSMSIYEAVKGPQSENWYRSYLFIVGLVTLGAISELSIFDTIVWSIIFGVTIVRMKRLGMKIW